MSLYLYRYFSGHDHNLQYIKEDESAVNYVVSGAGHETDTSTHHKVAHSSPSSLSSKSFPFPINLRSFIGTMRGTNDKHVYIIYVHFKNLLTLLQN